MVTLPNEFGSLYDRHKIKIASLIIAVAIALSIFMSWQNIMEGFKPFADNPLAGLQKFWIFFVFGLLFIFVMILISKIINRAGLGDDLSSPPGPP